MKVILIDDEPIALDVLQYMLEPYKEINIIGSYTRPADALESIKEVKPDVIFLDIQMGEINGLELAEIFIRELINVEIVFVTAYSQYAVDAFEINAIDYLLKPIQEKRLFKAVERLKERNGKSNIESKATNSLDKQLKVYSFGGFQVLDSMENPLTWRTQKSKELFAYLWERGERPVSKTLIMEAIFPDRDVDKASALLHTTIYQIRKNLKTLGHLDGISYFDESYQLNLPIKSDLDRLKKLADLKKHNDENIREVLEIHRGDFLEEGYHWAMESQQKYRDLVFNILKRFAKGQLERQNFNSNLKICLDQAHQIDPLNEDIAEMTLHYYGKQKKRYDLEAFFNDYVERLWEEIKLDPMERTINIYKKYMENI